MSAGPAARILGPSPDATDGVTRATRRGTGVTGFDCGAGAYFLRRRVTSLARVLPSSAGILAAPSA
jgi:hypothetical protein